MTSFRIRWVLFQELCMACLTAFAMMVAHDASAQVISEGYIKYSFGAFQVVETPGLVAFFRHSHLIFASRIKPGGLLVPDIYAHEDGTLDLGDQQRFDLVTGQVKLASTMSRCSSRKKSMLAGQATRALAMTPVKDSEQHTVGYRSDLYDLGKCNMLASSFIKPEDTASFFEYRASQAGWWLLGSQDATMLISSSGKTWQKLTLPKAMSSVLSAYWPSKDELWVLGNDLVGKELKLAFYKSTDQGHSWKTVKLEQEAIPTTWFEAARQVAAER
jgi:hypothetical protein